MIQLHFFKKMFFHIVHFSAVLQQLQHIQSSISTVIMAIFSSNLLLFLYCYFGKIASESALDIVDLLFQSNWQVLPIKLQKYIIIMIANAQHPLDYDGFGVAVLNLETYAKVCQIEGGKYQNIKIYKKQHSRHKLMDENLIYFLVNQISAYVLYDVQDPVVHRLGRHCISKYEALRYLLSFH